MELQRDKPEREARVCLSQSGMAKRAALFEKAVVPFNNLITGGRNIFIAVAGATRRTGTTTAAFHLAGAIRSLGAGVAYLEVNGSGHLRQIARGCSKMTGTDGHYTRDGISYYDQIEGIEDGYSFIVYDFGELTEDKVEAFLEMDIRVLCGGGRAYEREALKAAKLALGEADCHTLIHSVPPEQRQELTFLFGGSMKDVFFPGWSPDLFDGSENMDIWRAILAQQSSVEEAC